MGMGNRLTLSRHSRYVKPVAGFHRSKAIAARYSILDTRFSMLKDETPNPFNLNIEYQESSIQHQIKKIDSPCFALRRLK